MWLLALLSLVNLVCEVDLPSVSGSDCALVGPQTFSFSRKRGVCFAVECDQYKKRNKHGCSALPVGAHENASEGGA